MKFNMDIKTLILIISTACVLAGFYYDTKAKLNTISDFKKIQNPKPFFPS